MKKSTIVIGVATFLLIVVFLIGFGIHKAVGQTVYPYQADRPRMAIGAYNVGVHQLDYEGAINYGKYFKTTTTSTIHQFRYGVYDHLELRSGFSFQHCDYADKDAVSGVSNINLGIKIPIILDTSAFPAVAIIGNVILPHSGKAEFAVDNYLKSLSLSVQKSFGTATIVGNIGIMTDAHAYDGCYVMNPNTVSHKAQGTYSLSVYKYQGSIAVFMETYGYCGSGSSDPFGAFDLGIIMIIKDNVSADFSLGASYMEGLDISFCNWGVSWLIPNKTK